VKCQCLPQGCDCDQNSESPDSLCPSNQKCTKCRCLPDGCDCDVTVSNPDSFCAEGEVCKDCSCQPLLAPGCSCDPDSPNPDSFCPQDQRCLASCQCKSCPQSDGGGQGQGQEEILNPPITFVIDTTKSVKPDKDSIFNLTKKVVDGIKNDKINIPRFMLVSFNDFGREINLNVQIEIDTPDVELFGASIAGLKFESYNGGRDSKERLTQGLLVALQNASPRTLIVVFTDNGSKDLRLEREIVRLRESKQCEVYIVLTPAYEGRITGKSLPAYGRMGQVFLINEVGSDIFLQKVQEFETNNCL